jgi:hypothetical protein
MSWLSAVRDAAIVVVALESIIIGILLAVILIQIRKLIRLLRDEVGPMLHDANETVQNVKGTSEFVSDKVVHPLIEAKSYTAGVATALRQFAEIRRKIKSE